MAIDIAALHDYDNDDDDEVDATLPVLCVHCVRNKDRVMLDALRWRVGMLRLVEHWTACAEPRDHIDLPWLFEPDGGGLDACKVLVSAIREYGFAAMPHTLLDTLAAGGSRLESGSYDHGLACAVYQLDVGMSRSAIHECHSVTCMKHMVRCGILSEDLSNLPKRMVLEAELCDPSGLCEAASAALRRADVMGARDILLHTRNDTQRDQYYNNSLTHSPAFQALCDLIVTTKDRVMLDAMRWIDWHLVMPLPPLHLHSWVFSPEGGGIDLDDMLEQRIIEADVYDFWMDNAFLDLVAGARFKDVSLVRERFHELVRGGWAHTGFYGNVVVAMQGLVERGFLTEELPLPLPQDMPPPPKGYNPAAEIMSSHLPRTVQCMVCLEDILVAAGQGQLMTCCPTSLAGPFHILCDTCWYKLRRAKKCPLCRVETDAFLSDNLSAYIDALASRPQGLEDN